MYSRYFVKPTVSENKEIHQADIVMVQTEFSELRLKKYCYSHYVESRAMIV